MAMGYLWDYFEKNDISEAIPNIVDGRVYLVYSDYDKPNKGDFKMTLGYRTADLSYIYEGLEGVRIPPTDFAVFEAPKGGKQKPEDFVLATWEKLLTAELPRSNQFDVEVYTLDEKTLATTHAELRISISK